MRLVKDGKLIIPLYHGTTELFIKSIKTNGLGGIDPLEEIEAKQTMKELFEIAEGQNWTDENWYRIKASCEPYVLQKQEKGTLNFQHGEAYLTYSPELAARYALENPFGCEYLSQIRYFIEFLASRNIDGFKEKFLGKPVLKLWERPHNPHILTLNNLSLSSIATETGADMSIQLAHIEHLIKSDCCDASSFKLREPTPERDIEINKIGIWGPNGTLDIKSGPFKSVTHKVWRQLLGA